MSLRDQILAQRSLPREMVSCPEWQVDVWVSVMSGADRDSWEHSIVANKDQNMRNMRARLVVFTATDENGVRLFDEAEVELVGSLNSIALNRIVDVVQRINRLRN